MPTLDARRKEDFHTAFDCIVAYIPTNEKVLFLGDFTARVGKNADPWNVVTGGHGVGNVNDNGAFLLSKCAQYKLLIMNTTVRMKDKFKASRTHPWSKH